MIYAMEYHFTYLLVYFLHLQLLEFLEYLNSVFWTKHTTTNVERFNALTPNIKLVILLSSCNTFPYI